MSARRSRKMTDAQLDEILAAVNGELLGHLEATIDPSRLLADLMSPGHGQHSAEPTAPAAPRDPGRSPAREMIRKRALASDLLHDLARAYDLAHALDLDFGLDRALDLDLARDIAREVDHACARARALGHDDTPVLVDVLDALRAMIDDRYLDHVDVHALVSQLDLSAGRARRTAADSRAQPVDASGADLSDLEIGDIDALDGVVWTRQTSWPPGIARQVEEHSEEIGDGVYRMRLGQQDMAAVRG